MNIEHIPEDVKAKILDEYRYWNVEHIEWWDAVYEGFTQDMAELGIGVARMYFSGFSSQGDGACFEGNVMDWRPFLAKLGYTDPVLIEHAASYFSLGVQHQGYYHHENCTHFSADLPLPEHSEDEWFLEHFSPYLHDRHSLREAVWMAVINKYDHNKLEREFVDVFKDHMRDLHQRLEREYDYLTSDQAVLEALEANEMLEELVEQATEELEHA